MVSTARRVAVLLAVVALVALLVSGTPVAGHEGESHTTTEPTESGGFDAGRVALSLGVGVGTAALAGVGLLLWRKLG